MPVKKNNIITVKIDDDLIYKVEELTEKINTKLSFLNNDSYKVQLKHLYDDLNKLENDLLIVDKRLKSIQSWLEQTLDLNETF